MYVYVCFEHGYCKKGRGTSWEPWGSPHKLFMEYYCVFVCLDAV